MVRARPGENLCKVARREGGRGGRRTRAQSSAVGRGQAPGRRRDIDWAFPGKGQQRSGRAHGGGPRNGSMRRSDDCFSPHTMFLEPYSAAAKGSFIRMKCPPESRVELRFECERERHHGCRLLHALPLLRRPRSSTSCAHETSDRTNERHLTRSLLRRTVGHLRHRHHRS